jgi:protein-disulfide isomerase
VARSSWSDRLSLFSTIAVAACAIVLVGFRLSDRMNASRRLDAQLYDEEPAWREYLSGGHRLGSESALVTIVEFADFQCPVCRSAAPLLDSIVAESEGQVSVLFRHFPLGFHAGAFGAAVAFVCADSVGAGERLAQSLWNASDGLGPSTDFAAMAQKAGILDTTAFMSCMTSDWARRRVLADSSAGARLRVGGTPTFLVGATRVNGLPPDRSAFRRIVGTELARVRKATAGTR